MKLLQYQLSWNKRIRIFLSFYEYHFCKENSEIDGAEEDAVADNKRSDCNFFIIIIINCILSSLNVFLIY